MISQEFLVMLGDLGTGAGMILSFFVLNNPIVPPTEPGMAKWGHAFNGNYLYAFRINVSFDINVKHMDA